MVIIPEKINLLYIEDDESVSAIMVEYLKRSKYTKFNMIIKNTLAKGLEYLDTMHTKLDAVLLDLVLPNSSGVDTFHSVNKKCGDILPIIIISGFEDIACKCVKLGAQDYLIKPDINSNLLVRSIKYSIERKKIEIKYKELRKELREEKDKTQKYLDIAGAIIVIDINQKVKMANKKICKLLGYTKDEIIGKNWFDNFLPKYIRSDVKKVFDKVVNDNFKAVRLYINPIITKDGSEKFISWINSVLRDESGNITGVLSSGEDVTEHKRSEEMIKMSEMRFRNLVEFTKANIYEIDFINNKFIYVNDVMCKSLGYTRKELMELEPKDILTEESINQWANRIQLLSKGEYIDPTFEYEVIKKDGGTGWVLITAEFIEDDNKNVTGANVVAIDITDKKLARDALKKKEDEVYAALETKIHDWRKEIIIRDIKREEQLGLINGEIYSMTNDLEIP